MAAMTKRFSAMWTDKLGEVVRAAAVEPYTMSLVGEDRRACVAAVNEGIDARLEACFVPERGDRFTNSGTRLQCVVSPESLLVLVRRLLEAGDDAGLASSICETLGIELV